MNAPLLFIKIALVLICFKSTFASASQVFRPGADRVSFELVDSLSGQSIKCSHTLLSHVPWWEVTCDDRKYTVDTWVQIRERGELKEMTLMYHVKESTSSSGTKLTQFKSHFTSFIVRGDSEWLGAVSHIDVRNGLADLVLTLQ
jgi:hypothetical protein